MCIYTIQWFSCPFLSVRLDQFIVRLFFLPRCAWTCGTLWVWLGKAVWRGTAGRSGRATSSWWSVLGASTTDLKLQNQRAAAKMRGPTVGWTLDTMPSALTQPCNSSERRWAEPKPGARTCPNTWRLFLSTLRKRTSLLSWGWFLTTGWQVT